VHLTQANLAIFQKGAYEYYSGIKIFNTLPTEIQDLSNNPKKFETALKHFFVFTLLFILWMNILTVSMSFDKQYSLAFLQSYSISME